MLFRDESICCYKYDIAHKEPENICNHRFTCWFASINSFNVTSGFLHRLLLLSPSYRFISSLDQTPRSPAIRVISRKLMALLPFMISCNICSETRARRASVVIVKPLFYIAAFSFSPSTYISFIFITILTIRWLYYNSDSIFGVQQISAYSISDS